MSISRPNAIRWGLALQDTSKGLVRPARSERFVLCGVVDRRNTDIYIMLSVR